jgi:hypothetical protein
MRAAALLVIAAAAGVHPEVETCVIARIKSWSFPTFTGDVMVISWPHTMQPT